MFYKNLAEMRFELATLALIVYLKLKESKKVNIKNLSPTPGIEPGPLG